MARAVYLKTISLLFLTKHVLFPVHTRTQTHSVQSVLNGSYGVPCGISRYRRLGPLVQQIATKERYEPLQILKSWNHRDRDPQQQSTRKCVNVSYTSVLSCRRSEDNTATISAFLVKLRANCRKLGETLSSYRPFTRDLNPRYVQNLSKNLCTGAPWTRRLGR